MNNEKQNQQLLLKRHPAGIAGPNDFECIAAPMPNITDGEVLVEAHYIGLDAALRLIMRDSDDFLFSVKPGDLVFGTMVGEIIESNNPAFEIGEFVSGSLGVQNYGVSDGSNLERCDPNQMPLAAWLGGYGTSGLTAYFALFHECKPQPGQTVLVTGAAGAVGVMAGQFAKLAGARTIGLAGSADKCNWLMSELGYDVAINYKDADWFEQLERAAPNLLDVIFDNVGGTVLDASLKLINLHGVALLCGSVSQYVAEEMSGPANYIQLGTMRARLQGFVVFDYAEHYATARKRMAHWHAAGQLKFPEHVVDGSIADFPSAFQQLYEGANTGKMLLRLR